MLSVTPTRRELLIWIAIAVVAVTVVVSVGSDPAGAGAVVATGPSTQVVYIATGENFPDALAAASPAGIGLGPVLLVQQNSIPAATLAELNRLEPRRVLIVGGSSVISDAVFNAIDALAFNPLVTRISGTNRYETAAEISQATFPTSGYYPRAAFSIRDDVGDFAGGSGIDLLGVSITAPTSGILIINAGADTSRDASDAIVSCWIWLNDNSNILPGSLRFIDLDTTGTEENCSTEVAVEVPPGEFDLAFRLLPDAGITIGEGTLTVVWIPFGSEGEIPTSD